MAKLKEIDRRPKHQFEPGDLVRTRKGMRVLPEAQGVVLEVHSWTDGSGRQECLCVFAAKQVDTYEAVREFIVDKAYETDYVHGTRIMNTQLEPAGKAPRQWFIDVQAAELDMQRFRLILED
jgi:hypothetical protein